MLLQILCNIHRKTPVLEPLFYNIAGFRPATLLKRDFNTGVFSKHFEEHLISKMSAYSSFWFAFVLNPPSEADTGNIGKHFEETFHRALLKAYSNI